MNRVLTWLSYILCVLPLTASCGVNGLDWTEEVQLPDGRVVTLTRHEEFGGRYEPGQSPTSSVSGFEFDHPDTKERIHYPGTIYFSTVALFVHEKTVYLVLTYYLGGKGSEEGCPQPPFVFTKYVQGGWQRISFKEAPAKQVVQNMILGAKGVEKDLATHSYRLNVAAARKIGTPIDGPVKVNVLGMDGPRLICPERLNLPKSGVLQRNGGTN